MPSEDSAPTSDTPQVEDTTAPLSGDLEAGGSPDDSPAPFIGDLTEETALDRLNFVGDLPEQLRNLESRVSGQVAPVLEQLKALHEKVGTQPVFEPKLDKVEAALRGYDEKLAEVLMPVLGEALKESMTITPIGQDVLNPLVSPLLQESQTQLVQQVAGALLAPLPFDTNDVVNWEDPANPTSDLQKDFYKWWAQQDAPTQAALTNYDLNFVGAMQRFSKWREETLKGKGSSATGKVSRLAAGQPPRSGAKPPSAGPRSLDESFDAGVAAIRAEMGR